jgi:trimethylamine--corrinoid protein Co-methyltransferase
MLVNQISNQTVRFRVLSEDQIRLLYRAALEVLARTGVRVCDPEGLDLMRQAGAEVTDGDRARLPATAVERALAQCPSTVRMVGRDPRNICLLERNAVHFGSGSDCPFRWDRETGERTRWTPTHIRDAARLADALPKLDFHMSLGLTAGVPRMTYDRHQFLAMLEGTTKPLVQTAIDRDGLRDQYEMACLVRGSEEAHALAPLLTLYAEPTSPLTHTSAAVQKLLFAAEKRIPTVYTSCNIAGATSPITGAGTLVLSLAESLSGIVMSQQKSPGAPVIIGGVASIMDMRTMVYSYGAPELSLFQVGLTEVCRWLGLPVFSTAGCTDAKVVDQQAAIEATFSIMLAMLSGANLIHDVGFLEMALTGSEELMVLSDEVIGMCERICESFPVDDETLLVDLIAEVGPGGEYVSHQHTFDNFRRFWQPRDLIREFHENWVAQGCRTLGQRLRERVLSLLAEHEPEPLPADLHRELQKIVNHADAHAERVASRLS